MVDVREARSLLIGHLDSIITLTIPFSVCVDRVILNVCQVLHVINMKGRRCTCQCNASLIKLRSLRAGVLANLV